MDALDQLSVTRTRVVELGDALGSRLTIQPRGFANHALWNFGHLAVTTALLTYGLSGQEHGLDPDLVTDFKKGSSPGTWSRAYAWEDLRGLLTEQPAQVARDVAEGRFASFQRYETSAGVVLESVEQALAFNTFHEGLHLGYVMAMRKHL